MELSRIIIDKIKKEGPLSFHDFMETALYYPGLGYYTSGKEKFGTKGDYYTSPFLGNIYGQLIGKQLEEMWCRMHKIPMTLVEYGGGAGILCYDILNYLAANPGLSSHLKYYIIEKSPHLQMQQKKLLAGKVEWINNLDEIKGFKGCILSNEVVDNFPVNLLVMKTELMEVYVDFKDKFTEVLMPAHDGIKEYFLRNNIHLPSRKMDKTNRG
jgi:SAM-dependent MidA family methyltransferase